MNKHLHLTKFQRDNISSLLIPLYGSGVRKYFSWYGEHHLKENKTCICKSLVHFEFQSAWIVFCILEYVIVTGVRGTTIPFTCFKLLKLKRYNLKTFSMRKMYEKIINQSDTSARCINPCTCHLLILPLLHRYFIGQPRERHLKPKVQWYMCTTTNWVNIVSSKGLSPVWHQAIHRTNIRL